MAGLAGRFNSGALAPGTVGAKGFGTGSGATSPPAGGNRRAGIFPSTLSLFKGEGNNGLGPRQVTKPGDLVLVFLI